MYGDVGKVSSFERTWSQTGRRQRSFEHFARLVEEPFQPDRPAVAPQRVGAQSQVKKDFEQLPQARVEPFQLVAVQPEISQGEVEPDDRLGTDVAQRAVVQVESGGRETRERLGMDAHVSVSVDEQMLQRQPVERPRLDGADPVVAEIQPAEMGEVRERADLDAFQTALAEVEVLERRVARDVGARHRRPAEQVPVEVELQRVRGNVARDDRQSSTRAVDDATRRVTEARARTLRHSGPADISAATSGASPFSQRLAHVTQ